MTLSLTGNTMLVKASASGVLGLAIGVLVAADSSALDPLEVFLLLGIDGLSTGCGLGSGGGGACC